MTARPQLTATYRLQMNAGFTLDDARARVAYLAALGISHLYLSPVLAARRGSTHGYDVVDPTRVNPELGGEGNLRALSDDLHAHDMSLIIDIVPNHMGTGAENRYWDDVLERGEQSRYARWFDIDWTPRGGVHRRLVLPVLGDDLDHVIERGELTIELRDGETPRVAYFSNSFPLDQASLPPDLQLAEIDPEEAGGLAAAYARPEGHARLRALLDAQHYRLMAWRAGVAEINYRRFFDVNDLAAVRVEDPDVFTATHAFILRLVNDGVVDGLRIDHIDGLLDPRAYLDRLRAATPPETLIFVEKILSPGEALRSDWPVQGTTGYEFLNTLDDVFIDPGGFRKLDTDYQRLRHMGDETFEDTADEGKQQILSGALSADVDRLVRILIPIARASGHRWPTAGLTDALVELIAALPVYRTYIAPAASVHPDDREAVGRAVATAQQKANADIVAYIGALILDEPGKSGDADRLDFVQRLQQLSGPVTAKGVEDTALYAYLPLASRNEVGGSPDRLPLAAVEQLHGESARRVKDWPLSLLATNTHDTKRSADVRSRLHALSQLPEEWDHAVERWRGFNERHRRTVNGRSAPDLNTEYLLYQTLVGLWPAPSGKTANGVRSDAVTIGEFPSQTWREEACARITEYMLKASREAKMRTSWTDPDAGYEDDMRRFVSAILDPRDDPRFLIDLSVFAARVASIGVRNALSRIVIHLTSPGTPDIYQGDELWNYTLVDPDNRRPVDYERRASLLAEENSIERDVERGTLPLPDDRMKLFVTRRLLRLRRRQPELFTKGAYHPLVVRGSRAQQLVAFARTHDAQHLIVVAPRLVNDSLGLTAADTWSDTVLELPPTLASAAWQSQFASNRFSPENGVLRVSDLLAKLPITVLAS